MYPRVLKSKERLFVRWLALGIVCIKRHGFSDRNLYECFFLHPCASAGPICFFRTEALRKTVISRFRSNNEMQAWTMSSRSVFGFLEDDVRMQSGDQKMNLGTFGIGGVQPGQ